MSIDDGSREPPAESDLSLNPHSHSIRSNNNIGAGVNATSKLDITLVTSCPLLELVWSPRKGISVKSSGHIITEGQAAFLWGFGPSNMAVSSTKSISNKRNSSDNFIDEKNDITSPCPVNLDVEKVAAIGDLVQGHGEGHIPFDRVGNSSACGVIRRNVSSRVIPSEEGPITQHNVSTDLVESKIALETPGAMTKTLDRLESSAENYLLAEASKLANPVTLNDHKDICQQHEGIHVVGETVHADSHLINQRTKEYLRKGKGKAVSDGDVNDQPAENTNSHGSAGSCNSKMLALSGNTKRSLDQRMIVTSKRVKESVGRDSDSAAFIKQSSSFMNWITNMIKGYPESNHVDAHTPSSVIDCMLTNTTHVGHKSHSQKPVDCSHELRGEGFRNLFQSIYCSNSSSNAVPLAAYETSDCIPKEICRSSKVCDHPTNHRTSPSKKRMILSSDFPMSENKILPTTEPISCDAANEMEMVKSSPCVDKERESYEFKHEEKAGQATGRGRDELGSLWITRFFPRVSRVLPNSENNGSSGNGLVNVLRAGHSLGDTVNDTLSEPLNGFAKPASLVNFEQVSVKDEQKPEQNMEVMASVFARRLDALKQVIPFDTTTMPEPIIQLQDSSKLDEDAEAKDPLDVGSGGRETGESPLPPLSTIFPDKNSVSTRVFDAIKKLRLSRSDFLRLMDSKILPPNIRGFYLRVRLSNTQVLGGKGYYVACIHGAIDRAGPKTTVAVTIGSFTCLVESRYISNQEFLQDELMTWWSGHSGTPPIEELEQKYEERTRLGF